MIALGYRDATLDFWAGCLRLVIHGASPAEREAYRAGYRAGWPAGESDLDHQETPIDLVFPLGCTDLPVMIAQAEAAGRRAASADLASTSTHRVPVENPSDLRDLLEDWLVAYTADGQALLGLDGGPSQPDGELSDWPLRRQEGSPRARVLDAAWAAYSAAIGGARRWYWCAEPPWNGQWYRAQNATDASGNLSCPPAWVREATAEESAALDRELESPKTTPALSFWEDEGAAEIVDRLPRWEPTSLSQIHDVIAKTWEHVDEIEEYTAHDEAWTTAAVARKLWAAGRISRALAEEAFDVANWGRGSLDGEARS